MQLVLPILACVLAQVPTPTRARDLGVVVGTLPTGERNAITDVAGVSVGHATLIEGEDIRTGVTLVFPAPPEGLYSNKVPAAVAVGNGYGKAVGFTQVQELGEIEAPIALTNTLSVGTVLEAMVARSLALPGHEAVRSINVVVGETNDGWLNDIRGQHISAEHVARAWAARSTGAVPEGSVGAGTGTVCFGFKGGIGTASRVVESTEPYTVGVLVQTNFGGRLTIAGRPFPSSNPGSGDGSCMIVLATDAPIGSRNLERQARRTFLGLARTGSVLSNGSGDYAIAFSTHPSNRIDPRARTPAPRLELPNALMSPLFQAAVEATEEAVLNSLVAARTVRGRDAHTAKAIAHEAVQRLVE